MRPRPLVAEEQSQYSGTSPALDDDRYLEARTTRAPLAVASRSRSSRGFTKGRKIAPFIRFVKGMCLVCSSVRSVDFIVAGLMNECPQRCVHDDRILDPFVKVTSLLKELLIHRRADPHSSHAIIMPHLCADSLTGSFHR